MPEFNTHLDHAMAAAAMVALFTGILVADVHGIQAGVAGGSVLFSGVVIGGTVPDVDSHSSVPRRYFNYLVIAGLIVLLSIISGVRFTGLETGLGITIPSISLSDANLIVIFGGAVLSAILVPPIVQHVMPGHRTLFHNLWFWIVAIGGTILLHLSGLVYIAGFSPALNWAVPIFLMGLFIGVMIHLNLDGELG